VTVRFILPTTETTQVMHTSLTLVFIQEMKRNVEMRKRVQKRGVSRKLDIHNVIARENANVSASGYCSQESTSSHLVLRLPKHLIEPQKWLYRSLETANAKLRRLCSDNIETKK